MRGGRRSCRQLDKKYEHQHQHTTVHKPQEDNGLSNVELKYTVQLQNKMYERGK